MAQQFSGLPRSPRISFKSLFPGRRVLLGIIFEASTVLKNCREAEKSLICSLLSEFIILFRRQV